MFTDREVQLEAEMSSLGEARRRSARSKARSLGRESLTRPGQGLVRAAMGRMVAALEDWIKKQEGHSVPSPVLVQAKSMPSKVAALLTVRAVLDAAGRESTWNATVHDLARRLEEERAARWLHATHPALWQVANRRARAVPERAAARLRRDVRRLMIDQGYPKWGMSERLRFGALLVHLAEQACGIFTLETIALGRRRRAVLLRVLPEVADWIAGADRKDDRLEPLFLPMLDVPGDWGPGQLGGYATPIVRREYLVKNRSKATRQRVAEAAMPSVYAAVNALQRTAWEVNPDVLEVATALWDSGQEAPGLARGEDDPMPPRGDSREAWRRRFLVRRGNLYRASRRAEAARVLWLARRMRPEGRFHFPQSLDFRGRTYPVPQFLQPQGPDLARGLLRFGEGEWMSDGDPEWFWLHGANCFGFDKLSIRDRVLRIAAHRQDILGVAKDPLDCRWWQEAAEPWQFLAWCLEAGELLETGRVLTRVPCYVDGTNNGLQILSLLMRDEVGGAATNCVPGTARRDIYQDVADVVTARLKGADDDPARAWLAWFEGGRMPRAAAKRTVMCVPYGCTEWSGRQYVLDWYEEERRQGREAVGERPGALATYLADHLWAAVRQVLGRALECMEWLRSVSRECVEAGAPPAWTTPSGFPVRQSYTKWQTQQVRCRLGERVRWVRSRRAGNEPAVRRHVNALPPNFVHSLDAAVLARVVARHEGPVSTIHDSFGTTAGRLGGLVRLVREEYAAVFSEDLLENFQQQLASGVGPGYTLSDPPQRGTLDARSVIDSQYLFS